MSGALVCATHSQACARQGLCLWSLFALPGPRPKPGGQQKEKRLQRPWPVTAVQREAGQEPSYPSCIYPSLLSSFSLFLQFLFHSLPMCSRLQSPPLCMQGLLYWTQSCPGQSDACTVAWPGLPWMVCLPGGSPEGETSATQGRTVAVGRLPKTRRRQLGGGGGGQVERAARASF